MGFIHIGHGLVLGNLVGFKLLVSIDSSLIQCGLDLIDDFKLLGVFHASPGIILFEGVHNDFRIIYKVDDEYSVLARESPVQSGIRLYDLNIVADTLVYVHCTQLLLIEACLELVRYNEHTSLRRIKCVLYALIPEVVHILFRVVIIPADGCKRIGFQVIELINDLVVFRHDCHFSCNLAGKSNQRITRHRELQTLVIKRQRL